MKWLDRIQLFLSCAVLLLGWLSPMYIAKWGGGVALNDFLRKYPVLAGVTMPMTFVVLLAAPSSAPSGRRDAGSDGRCRLGCVRWSPRAFTFAASLAILIILVHASWYASWSRTSVATNTVLWNSDTLSTPFIAAVINMEMPHSRTVLGGLLGLLGVVLSVDSGDAGDTLLGCALCIAASVGYALNAVLVEKFQAKYPNLLSMMQLLGLQGATILLVGVIIVCVSVVLIPTLLQEWHEAFPPLPWFVVLAIFGLFLNLGWYWCTALAGASWTAMAACLTIPISMLLDFLLLSEVPCLTAVIGGILVVIGFTVASCETGTASEPSGDNDTACYRRWSGWKRDIRTLLLSPGQASTETPEPTQDCRI